jgi:hypothetical protein
MIIHIRILNIVGNHFIQRIIGCKRPILKTINAIILVPAYRPCSFRTFRRSSSAYRNSDKFYFPFFLFYKITRCKSTLPFYLGSCSILLFYSAKVRREETWIFFLRPNVVEIRRNGLFERLPNNTVMFSMFQKQAVICIQSKT